jgi:hypothetical protein
MKTTARWILILTALAVGCSDDDEPTGLEPAPSPYVAPISPEAVIENFMAAHRELDIDAYKAATSARFEFLPAPGDTVPYLILTKTEDDAIMENLLDNIESFDIDLTYADAVPCERQDLPDSEGYMQISATALLRVTTREGGAGDPLTLLVSNEPTYFVFEPDSTQSPVTWEIRLHQDLAESGKGLLVELATWGSIKTLFH